MPSEREYCLHKDPAVNAKVNSDIANLEMALALAAEKGAELADSKAAVPALYLMMESLKVHMAQRLQHMVIHHPEIGFSRSTDAVLKEILLQVYYAGYEMGRVGHELTEHESIGDDPREENKSNDH